MPSIYSTTVTSHGGRDGSVRSEDGVIDLKLVLPKELGGPGGAFANPEELFAAGYAACFHGALKLVAGKEKISMLHSIVTAKVGIGPNDAGGLSLEVDMTANIPGVTHEQAEELMRAAHTICPYSNATRGNIPVRLAVTTDASPAVALA